MKEELKKRLNIYFSIGLIIFIITVIIDRLIIKLDNIYYIIIVGVAIIFMIVGMIKFRKDEKNDKN